MDYRREAHKVYSLYYHIIFVVKYRKRVFIEGIGIIEDLKDKIDERSKAFEVEILEIECGIDHVHLLISSKPTLNIVKYINSVKGSTSRFLRLKYHWFLKKKLWGKAFWSASYFIATTGKVSIETLKKYIENQREFLDH